MRAATVTTLAAAALLLGCAPEPELLSRRGHALEAYCTATVDGSGMVSVEDDYLPNVINCENGAAAYEALKAQAVAARTYLYYRLDRTGSIADGTGDQVYSCGSEPAMQHYLAAAETAGQVLQYQGVQIAGFFVAGAHQTGPSCQGGTSDPTNTERYVTYNEGKSGNEITQTSLGLVEPTNKANRGCKSQNGAHCLGMAGRLYDDILRFYYGADIELVQALGVCVPEEPAGGDAGPVEGSDAGVGGSDDGLLAGCSIEGSRTALLWLAVLGVAVLLRGRPRKRRARRRRKRRSI